MSLTDYISFFSDGSFQQFLTRRHYTQVDDPVVITSQYHAHDVLTDIMNISFDSGQHNCTNIGSALLERTQSVINRKQHVVQIVQYNT